MSSGERISFLTADNIAILTHATARAKLHTAHETDANTIQVIDISVHAKCANFRGKKKTSARIDFLQVTQVALSEPFLDFVYFALLARYTRTYSGRAFRSPRAISKRFRSLARNFKVISIEPKIKKNERLGASLTAHGHPRL